MTYLLDTDVVLELRRSSDPNVARWAEDTIDDPWYLSVLTLGEIRKGIERIRPRDPMQAETYREWLDGLYVEFEGRLLDVDTRVADEWGRISASKELPETDGLIAATARVHGLAVATRNTSDFEPCRVPVVNPWDHRAATS